MKVALLLAALLGGQFRGPSETALHPPQAAHGDGMRVLF